MQNGCHYLWQHRDRVYREVWLKRKWEMAPQSRERMLAEMQRCTFIMNLQLRYSTLFLYASLLESNVHDVHALLYAAASGVRAWCSASLHSTYRFASFGSSSSRRESDRIGAHGPVGLLANGDSRNVSALKQICLFSRHDTCMTFGVEHNMYVFCRYADLLRSNGVEAMLACPLSEAREAREGQCVAVLRGALLRIVKLCNKALGTDEGDSEGRRPVPQSGWVSNRRWQLWRGILLNTLKKSKLCRTAQTSRRLITDSFRDIMDDISEQSGAHGSKFQAVARQVFVTTQA